LESEAGVLNLFGPSSDTALSHTTEQSGLECRTELADIHGDGEERRQAPRVPLPVGVAATTASGHLVELLNTSPGGWLLRSTHPVRAGERHVLRIPDNDFGCVTIDVNVVHAERSADSWGGFVVAGVALAS
jgi:hypothetical protein